MPSSGIDIMNVLITGANGFIGKNLQLYLRGRQDVHVQSFTRDHKVSDLESALRDVDFVFHLAGSNRPMDPAEFELDNTTLTEELCNALASISKKNDKKPSVIYTSSTQIGSNNVYGDSKRAAEKALIQLQCDYGVPVYLFRLPNVFGKWARPNYNSVVATFCHNITRGLPIQIDDPLAPLTLVYIDDVIGRFIELMDGADRSVDMDGFEVISPQYTTTVGELAKKLNTFNSSRSSLLTERVGTGLLRALYSTYVSYLPTNLFAYSLPRYEDARGLFVEMLKTPDCGQFSYFTAYPGVTRGGHYHHSKTEKFLVIKGLARFKFKHMHTHEEFELVASEELPVIVETIPGWSHNISNIGDDEMIVMLWANELFDQANPDTHSCPL
jgi:UDP-2-acetamido-2,6-beta-L-arabino-hexul-4-ose reductase